MSSAGSVSLRPYSPVNVCQEPNASARPSSLAIGLKEDGTLGRRLAREGASTACEAQANAQQHATILLELEQRVHGLVVPRID